MDNWLFAGVVPSVSRADYSSQLPPLLRELANLSIEIRAISKSEVYVESRMGFSDGYSAIRFRGLNRKKAEEKRYEKPGPVSGPVLCPIDPAWGQLIVGMASSVWVTAVYKILKAWIEAKAGREIKLTLGKWQVEFKGLSRRQVVKLFRELESGSTEPISRSQSTNLEIESAHIAALLKELNIPAVEIQKKPTRSSVKRRKRKRAGLAKTTSSRRR